MVSTGSDDARRAAEQAEANARLEGTELDDDERELIARRRRGEITQEEFLAAARDLAVRKAGGEQQ